MRIKESYFNILSLFCVISLLFSIPIFGSTQVGAETKANQSTVIVSMGDSYSSGEGIEDFYGLGDVNNKDWLAHRSKNAWAGQLTLDGISKMSDDKYDEKEKPNGNWFFVAASGAETKHICDEKQPKSYKKKDVQPATVYLPKQIDVFDILEKKGKKADYVTLTLGGNDADFAGVMKTVAHPFYLYPNAIYSKLKLSYYDRREEIFSKLYTCYDKISEKAGKQAYIIVAGYPHLLDETGEGALASVFEAKAVNRAVDDFNKYLESRIQDCPASMNIRFVPVAHEFSGHEAYSDTLQLTPLADKNKQKADINKGELKGEFINRILLLPQEQDISTDPPSAYSMHPNLRGAEVYRKCVQNEIDDIEKKERGTNNPTNLPTEAKHEYTAVELANKSLDEIIEIMGGDFVVEYEDKHLIGITSGGLHICNNEKLPGFAIFVEPTEEYSNSSLADYYSNPSGVKQDILNGKYKIYFIGVYDNAKYDKDISADMKYLDVAKVTGNYELLPLVGSAMPRQSLYSNATVYYDAGELNEESIKSVNPKIKGISVQPTKKQETTEPPKVNKVTFDVSEADVEVGYAIDVYCTSGHNLSNGNLKSSAGDYSKCFKINILGDRFNIIANREGSETFTFTSENGEVGSFTLNAIAPNNMEKLTEEEVRRIAQNYWHMDSSSGYDENDGTKYGIFIDVNSTETMNGVECYRADLKWEPQGSTVYSRIDWIYIDIYTGETYNANGEKSSGAPTA